MENVSVIVAAISGAAGVLISKGVDVVIRWKKAKQDGELNFIDALQAQIWRLQAALERRDSEQQLQIDRLHETEAECRVENARLRVRLAEMEERERLTNEKMRVLMARVHELESRSGIVQP